MKPLLILISVLILIAPASAQPVPPSTSFSRYWLLSTNQAQARERLGVTASGGLNTAEIIAIMATNNAATATTATNAILATNAVTATNIANQIWQKFPLQLPNWTGTPNSAHPSLLHFSTNWNGYPFWFAYTPYPPGSTGTAGDRWRRGAENPTILASKDGVHFVEPFGLVNPIATEAESPLYDYSPSQPNPGDSGGHLSDPELWMNGSTMVCLYRANAGVAPVSSSSSVTIGTGSKAFTIASGLGGFAAGTLCRVYGQVSQANYMEGIISSYIGTTITINVTSTGGSGTINSWWVSTDNVYLVNRTSTDGITWSAPTRVLTNVGGGSILAPQVVKLGSGTTRVFYAAGGSVAFRDATDDSLTAYGAETQASGAIPAWHLDIQRRTGNELWGVYGVSGGVDPYSNLRLSISADNGASWTLISTNIMPRSGAKFDYFGYYKPEFYFVNDGTDGNPIKINLYSDTGQPFNGSSRAGETVSFTGSLQPFYASDAWKIGLWENVIVPTNATVAHSFTTNAIPADSRIPMEMYWNPATTNWEFEVHADGWINRISSRQGKFVEQVNTPALLFMGSLTNALKLFVTSGDTTGGTLRLGSTNTSSTLVDFVIGGDSTSLSAINRGFHIWTSSLYNRVYIAWGHSMGAGTDAAAEMQIAADLNNEPLNVFELKANTFSFTGTGTGNGVGFTNLTESIVVAASDETTPLTTGTGKVTFRMPFAMKLSSVRATLSTAQTSGSILTINVKESGSTIFSTKPTLDNTEKTTTTAATASVLSDTDLADDAEITVDIDQVGDGTAKGLKVTFLGRR